MFLPRKLYQNHGNISYYARKDGREIDFILERRGVKPIALECKETPTNTDFTNLKRLSEKLSVSESMLIHPIHSFLRQLVDYPTRFR